jgi:hypothetical protein
LTKENRNEDTLRIIQPGKGKHVNMTGDILSIYLSKNETNGTFSILEDRIYPGGGPPPQFKPENLRDFIF